MRTRRISQVAVIATFAATLLLRVAVAVGIGVTLPLPLPLPLHAEAMDLAVVELIPRDDGRVEERPPPAVLTSHHVTVLDVYGSTGRSARYCQPILQPLAAGNAPGGAPARTPGYSASSEHLMPPGSGPGLSL